MVNKNISLDFRLEEIDETRNYFLEEIEQDDLMSEKHKKVCKILNYIQHFLIFLSAITGSVSISAFAWLVGIPIGTRSSVVGLKICALTTAIKKYKSTIKKKRKKQDKIALLAKTERNERNTIENLISKL